MKMVFVAWCLTAVGCAGAYPAPQAASQSSDAAAPRLQTWALGAAWDGTAGAHSWAGGSSGGWGGISPGNGNSNR